MFNFSQLYDYLKVPETSLKLERLGDILQFALPWAAIMFVAFTGDVTAAWAWLYGCITTMIVVEILKYGLNHTKYGKRPNGGARSFPSGHTALAFAGATFFACYWGWFSGIIALSLAALTGLSRMVSKNHWARDVVAGAMIGGASMHYHVLL